MMTVLASALFALPASLVVCFARGFGLLQCSSVMLVALLAIPTFATIGILLVQAFRLPQRHPRRAACELRFQAAVPARELATRRQLERVES